MIRILLVDDQVLFRESLGRLFAQQHDMEVAGQCGGADDAIEELKRKQVDVVIASWRLGPEFLAAARRKGGAERTIVIADRPDAEDSLSAFHSGACAILSRHTSYDVLTRAIRLVASGGTWLDQKTMGMLVSPAKPRAADEPFSDREQRIMRGLCEGLTNRRIAESMGTSESTVKAILHRLFRKTHTASRTQLVRRALEGTVARQK